MKIEADDSSEEEARAMANIVRRRQAHPDWFDQFGWPFTVDGRTFGERLFNWRDDMIRVEEFTDGTTEVIRAEAPGIDPDKDVELTITDNTLSLRVERRDETKDKAGDGFRTEFRYGALSRVMPLPDGAKADDITATYTHGILEIRVPVEQTADRPTPRRVEVKTT
jgi:HSP20 family protein